MNNDSSSNSDISDGDTSGLKKLSKQSTKLKPEGNASRKTTKRTGFVLDDEDDKK